MDKNNVLTAAHCIMDDFDLMDVTQITACTYGNDGCTGCDCSVPSGRAVQCRVGAELVVYGAYGSKWDTAADLAVIRMTEDFDEVESGQIEAMYLSKRSTSLEDYRAHTRGYPGGLPSDVCGVASDVCDNNEPDDAISGVDHVGTDAGVQFVTSGSGLSVKSDHIKFVLGTASGMSGGAVYYSWEADCEDGHGQTSLQSLYTYVTVRGPRSADFRSSVLGVL